MSIGRHVEHKVHYVLSQVQGVDKALLCWSKCHRVTPIEKEAFKKQVLLTYHCGYNPQGEKCSILLQKYKTFLNVRRSKVENHFKLWFCSFSLRIPVQNRRIRAVSNVWNLLRTPEGRGMKTEKWESQTEKSLKLCVWSKENCLFKKACACLT